MTPLPAGHASPMSGQTRPIPAAARHCANAPRRPITAAGRLAAQSDYARRVGWTGGPHGCRGSVREVASLHVAQRDPASSAAVMNQTAIRSGSCGWQLGC